MGTYYTCFRLITQEVTIQQRLHIKNHKGSNTLKLDIYQKALISRENEPDPSRIEYKSKHKKQNKSKQKQSQIQAETKPNPSRNKAKSKQKQSQIQAETKPNPSRNKAKSKQKQSQIQVETKPNSNRNQGKSNQELNLKSKLKAKSLNDSLLKTISGESPNLNTSLLFIFKLTTEVLRSGLLHLSSL